MTTNIITQEQLRALLTANDAETRAEVWLEPLNQCMQAGSITTARRQAAFLAQILLESGQLKHLEEDLVYKHPAQLCAVWPKRFASEVAAIPFCNNEQALANLVYANRMGNGDAASGDGWKYRGRGLIQLTGRDNYARFSSATGFDALNNPDFLQHPVGAALSAAWFWQAQGLNELADQALGGKADEQFDLITHRINGGLTAKDERRALWRHAKQVLGVDVA
ncbi:glycoside hydrolase family 19 protein [Massilia sp. YIM B04103]|uniref:glycoside hydrolase family 19 protein n=1 Tax=Massilia sp. YIM B04103 TaxID=2963106 RepID=UPI00210A63CD|nr:glycoside hydrolase family 19 protein [Massilia sp. YIM B04103]